MLNLLDTHLDLLETDIPGKHFVCLQDVLKTYSWHVFKTCSRHFFKTPTRHLQRNNFSCSKTSWRRLARCLQNVFKTSRKTKNCHAEDVLKTSSRHVFKTSPRRLKDLQMFAWQMSGHRKIGIYIYNIQTKHSKQYINRNNLLVYMLLLFTWTGYSKWLLSSMFISFIINVIIILWTWICRKTL